jgi:hypothetical protein
MSTQIADHAAMTNTSPRAPEPGPSAGKNPPTPSETTHQEEALDEALEESFPASDTPAVGASS